MIVKNITPLMQSNLEKYMSLYSKKQNCFHVEQLRDTIQHGIEGIHNQMPDYLVIGGPFKTSAEAVTYNDQFRHIKHLRDEIEFLTEN